MGGGGGGGVRLGGSGRNKCKRVNVKWVFTHLTAAPSSCTSIGFSGTWLQTRRLLQ